MPFEVFANPLKSLLPVDMAFDNRMKGISHFFARHSVRSHKCPSV